MKKQVYTLPIKVTVEADNPNTVIKEIADAIYEAAETVTRRDTFNSRVGFFDMDFSIYQKMSEADFEG